MMNAAAFNLMPYTNIQQDGFIRRKFIYALRLMLAETQVSKSRYFSYILGIFRIFSIYLYITSFQKAENVINCIRYVCFLRSDRYRGRNPMKIF